MPYRDRSGFSPLMFRSCVNACFMGVAVRIGFNAFFIKRITGDTDGETLGPSRIAAYA